MSFIRPVATRFFEACQAQDRANLSPACQVDFGLDPHPAIFDAYCLAVCNGCTAEELDIALGYSGRLNTLLKKYGQDHIIIAPTSYDLMAVDEYTKTTVGFVSQTFTRQPDGTYVCTDQEFICGDDVSREVDGEDVSDTLTLSDEVYQPLNMEKPARTVES